MGGSFCTKVNKVLEIYLQLSHLIDLNRKRPLSPALNHINLILDLLDKKSLRVKIERIDTNMEDNDLK